MSLAKLTSISTQTLSLLLERQRLETLPSFSTPSGVPTSNDRNAQLHIPQITRNLNQLRNGILDLEEKEGKSTATGLLRNQYERMRGMAGAAVNVEVLEAPQTAPAVATTPSRQPPPPGFALSPPSPLSRNAPSGPETAGGEPIYSPYSDNPDQGPEIMLQTQRHLMSEQDNHLDRLSHSINRQHHISLQINEELDVHSGLLQELDTDLYHTETRLTGARRRLEQVAKGAKENGSTVTIAVLILVLLILIIVYKT